MTKEELLLRLRELNAQHPEELDLLHIKMDAVLLGYVNDDRIQVEFELHPKYYSEAVK